ncbi:hypothetical protein KR074_007039 [Drosophila pseudoananassae]|nr:hypothetical protein KR074_007039 [Drosophila pseudoananassae]
MSPIKIENPCVICGSEAALMCHRCGEPYCSQKCQERDWQKHKHYCTSMPALVKINAKVKKPLEEVEKLEQLPLMKSEPNATKVSAVPVEFKSSIAKLAKNTASEPLQKTWREAYLPPFEDFFEARVTYMEADGPFWVVEASMVERLERLMDNMMKQMNLQKLVRAENIEMDSLVAVVVDGKVYRGHVIAVDVHKKTAEIRMIDNGALVDVQFKDVYKGIPKMFDIKAFAFRVKQPTTTGVQTNKNLTLRFVSNKTAEGYFNVQMKPKMTIPLSIPTELLKVTPELSVIRVFESDDSRKEWILVQLKALENINHELNEALTKKPIQNMNGPFPDEKCTFFLAARTKDGYRRAFLLDHFELPTPTFLVYEMDEGKVSICSEVSRIPSQLLGLPMRVFSIGPQERIYDALKKDGTADEVSVKFKQELPYCKDRLKTLNVNLLAKDGKSYGLVRLNTFLGTVADLGHKFWQNPIKNMDLVYITHVISYRELHISSQDTLRYANIFKCLEPKCKPFRENTEIPVGGIVLVACPKLGIFRGEVSIKNVSNSGEYVVQNVDTGACHTVDFKVLRVACRFLENMPVCLMRVILKTVRDVPEAAVPPNSAALPLLNAVCNQQEIFVLDMPDSNLVVDLLPRSGEKESLVGRILPVMFTSPKSEETKATGSQLITDVVAATKVSVPAVFVEPASSLPALPPSPPGSPDQTFSVDARKLLELSTTCVMQTTPFDRFYYHDLPKHLVPVGEDAEIICLNAGNMSQTGFITGCFFLNEKVADNFHSLLSLVATHGTCAHNSDTTYFPGIGELCLALYSGDNSWYRGVCLENDHKMTKILYCDFGNIETVPSENIKPIPSDALHPVYATKCFIDGFDKAKDFTALEEYLTRHAKVKCHVRNGPEADSRTITIPNLDNILTKVEI